MTEGLKGTDANFSLNVHPDTNTMHYLVPARLNLTETGGTATAMGVTYANMNGTILVKGVCTTPDGLQTTNVDMNLTLKKGWNVFTSTTTLVRSEGGKAVTTFTSSNSTGPVDLYAAMQYHLAD